MRDHLDEPGLHHPRRVVRARPAAPPSADRWSGSGAAQGFGRLHLNSVAQVAALQRQIGNAGLARALRPASTPVVQRCGPAHPDCNCATDDPVTVQTQREVVVQRKSAVETALASDKPGDEIGKLDSAALIRATPDQKISMIRIILEQNGPTHLLEKLWNNVADPVVEANIDLWKTTWAKHAGLMDGHARKRLFVMDVADVANTMLSESEALCQAHLEHYGLTPESEKPGQSTPERDTSIVAVQDTATEVMGAQTQLKSLWAVPIQTDPKYLGYGSSMKGSLPFELDIPPMYASAEGLAVWQKTNDAVKELTSSIDAYLEAFPELYPLVMGGQSSKKDAYADPSSTELATEKPLDAIEQGIRKTIANIQESKGRTVEILARERKLAPVEQQLLAGARTVAASRNWQSGPIWAAMVPSITEKPGLFTAEAGVMLGIQIALAVTTGGVGNLLFSAAQAALSHEEAKALQTASDTSLSDKDSIVKKQDVAAAKMTAAVDKAFLVLDIVPGFKQLRGVWGTVRGEARFVQAAADDLAKKSLAYEAKLMAKKEKPELGALLKEMEQQATQATTKLADAKSAAAGAQPAEKALVEAEVRKAEEALVRGQASIVATKAVGEGKALVVEMGGRRFSWVPKRGFVICASPCGKAADWLEEYGKVIVEEARAQSNLAAEAVQKQVDSAKRHLRDIDSMLTDAAWTKTPTPEEFERAATHAASVVGEVDAQKRFAMLRFPKGGIAAMEKVPNAEWAELLLAQLKRRREAIEETDRAFFGGVPGKVKDEAAAAHADMWKDKLGKFSAPGTTSKKVSSLIEQVEAEGRNAVVNTTNRSTLMTNIDKQLTNLERELRGQRELVLSGAEVKAFSDQAAGALIYPGKSAAEVARLKKPDYIAEAGDRIILGDSKGAGDVRKSIDQIKPAIDSPYVQDAIKAGKIVDCRVYLDASDALASGYKGLGHPPVLYELQDTGRWVKVMVRNNLPLHVYYN